MTVSVCKREALHGDEPIRKAINLWQFEAVCLAHTKRICWCMTLVKVINVGEDLIFS